MDQFGYGAVGACLVISWALPDAVGKALVSTCDVAGADGGPQLLVRHLVQVQECVHLLQSNIVLLFVTIHP